MRDRSEATSIMWMIYKAGLTFPAEESFCQPMLVFASVFPSSECFALSRLLGIASNRVSIETLGSLRMLELD